MLYPCSCPKEPDGGIARRGSLIKQLRKNNQNVLLLDSGGFFAGGLQDEYTQNTQLDSQRTLINLKALELMGYDAVGIGSDEFNFGREFLEDSLKGTKLAFLSCNIESDEALPYIVKEIAGLKIGIIGLTNPVAEEKAGGLKFIEPRAALSRVREELRKRNVNIIVLLSNLGEGEDLKLIKEIEGIDILIVGHSRMGEEPVVKRGNTLILRPPWQGRRLGVLSFTIKDDKIINYKIEELRLSGKISGDPQILAILPRCFSDNNCRQEDSAGKCLNPGTPNANCAFTKAAKVGLLVIQPKDCPACNAERLIGVLKNQFPGLAASYLYSPGAKADKLIKELGIKSLPAYLLDREIEKEEGFDRLQENLQVKGNFYLVKPTFGGIAHFIERGRRKGRLDLFISLYDKHTARLLDETEAFNPTIHFLAVEEKENEFISAKGNLEVEEYLRSVCVQKYYPEYFSKYISCRARNIDTYWWEDCLGNYDAARIKFCARSQEAKALLRENLKLNREIGVMSGPTYLLDNQEIFSSNGAPSKEELKKLINKE